MVVSSFLVAALSVLLSQDFEEHLRMSSCPRRLTRHTFCIRCDMAQMLEALSRLLRSSMQCPPCSSNSSRGFSVGSMRAVRRWGIIGVLLRRMIANMKQATDAVMLWLHRRLKRRCRMSHASLVSIGHDSFPCRGSQQSAAITAHVAREWPAAGLSCRGAL